MGRASTVTTVSTNRLRLLASCTLAAISSCSSLMRSCRPCMSRSTTENSSVESRSSCASSAPIQAGGCCSRRNSAAGSGASSRCSRTSRRRSTPSRARLWSRRPASSASSTSSMRWVTPRTMSTRPDACVRISSASSATLEHGALPLRTVVRRASTDRSGRVRPVTIRWGATLVHSVAMSEGSNAKSKWASLSTAISVSSSRSMRVDTERSLSASKKASGRWACRSIQRTACAWLRLKCSQRNWSAGAAPACRLASHCAAWAESTSWGGVSVPSK